MNTDITSGSLTLSRKIKLPILLFLFVTTTVTNGGAAMAKDHFSIISHVEDLSEYSKNERIFNHFKNIIPIIEKQGYTVLSDIKSFKGLNNQKVKLQCHECDTIIEKNLHNGKWKRISCQKCMSLGKSLEEQEVYDYLKSICNYEILDHYRIASSGKEIDFFDCNSVELSQSILWVPHSPTYPYYCRQKLYCPHLNYLASISQI